MITIFTPSFADELDTNAQNLTAKEVVARLNPHEFHVTLLSEGTPDPRICSRPNTRIWQWREHGNTMRVLWHLLRHRPDVYFFPREGPLDAGFLRMRRALGLRTAVVTYVVSGGELDHGSPRGTLARNIREGDVVVGNSRHMTQMLREQMRVAAETVYDGIDRRYFFPGKRGANAPLTVLFAGSLRPYKRAHIVVQQAQRWPQILFRIAGRGEEEERCRKLVVELACKNVSFTGHLSSQQLGEEMRRADIFLFPSVMEGHPQVLGQAAASGLPVVASNLYQPDFVVNGKTGFLVASDEELEQKLSLLLKDPQLRTSMGEAAILHARQFDWDSVAQLWEQVFKAALEARLKR
jgi:glycosyltransferase involved in cell wall biosynthesis